jgi:hypothetical protein
VPYRIAAPPEPDPPDPEAAYVADLRSRERRGRFLTVSGLAAGVVVAATLTAIPRSRAPEGEPFDRRQAMARSSLAIARDHAASEQARFEKGIRDAIGEGLVPRPDRGACPVDLPHRSGTLHGVAFPLLVIERVAIGSTLPSQAVAGLIADIRRAESHVALAHFEEASLYARALARPDRLTYEVVFVASSWTKPLPLGADSYVPGQTTGRAYLYDFASARVICAADVHTTSSRAVSYAYSSGLDHPLAYGRERSMETYVDDDFRAQLERAIADGMTSVAGPAD